MANLERIWVDVERIHGIVAFKPLQQLCLSTLVTGQDVLACLPTGFGKSIIYQTWATFADLLAKDGYRGAVGIVLVISPLISIMEDQTKHLMSKGIKAAYIGKDRETDQQIAGGEYNVVFSSPESLVANDEWRDIIQSKLYRDRLVGIAVDEVHTVVDWGLPQGPDAPFRKWYGQVGQLRAILPASVPILALTATASASTRDLIKKELGMHDCLEVVQCPDRPNIRLAVKKVSKDPCETFAWLCQELESKGPDTEKVVIYCKSIGDCGLLYMDVFKLCLGEKAVYPAGSPDVSSNRLVEMYHASTPANVKQHVLTSLSDPSSILRIVIATSALGMGVDLKGVNIAVNYGPPRNLEEYMQAFGRAGRDGGDAHSIILYHGIQKIGLSDTMRQYITHVSSCRRVKLLDLFDNEEVEPVTPKHACCDVCALSCDCKPQCGGGSSALEQHAGEPAKTKRREVSDDQKASLRTALEERRECLCQEGLYNRVAVYSTHHVTDAPSALIEEIVDSCSTLFTMEDILCQIQVSDTAQGQLIFEIIEDIFPTEVVDATLLSVLEDLEGMELD